MSHKEEREGAKDSQRGAQDQRGHESRAQSDLRWTGTEAMRPTQCSVGMLEVALKMEEFSERSKEPGCLEKYLQGHPIPAVMGPDGKLYLTDHHHMGLALMRLERAWDKSDKPAALNPFRRCCFEIVKDLSGKQDLSMGKFFAKMEDKSLCHPYGGDGSRSANIPESLVALEDDPYRSLAGLARKAGAYDKVDVPFTEFKWADYLRGKVDASLIKRETLAQAIEQAVALANLPAAKGLPGFKGRPAKELPSLAEIQSRLSKRHGAEDASPGLPEVASGSKKKVKS